MRTTYTAALFEDGSCMLEILEVANPPDVTLTVSGELGRDSRYALDAVVSRLWIGPPERVIVDLCQVGIVDAGGLGAVPDLQKTAAGSSGARVAVLARHLDQASASGRVGRPHAGGRRGAVTSRPIELSAAATRSRLLRRGRLRGASMALLARRWH